MDAVFQDFSTQERLIGTVLDMWATQGHAAISARNLSRATGLPTSSIYHHFGSMEHLFHSAQDHALKAARNWCSHRLDDLARWPEGGGPEALAAMMALLIDDWARDSRPLAFAWAQCHLLAYDDAAYLPPLEGWRDIWSHFWREICHRAGLGAFGAVTGHMFEGTAQLHLIRWHPTIDRAALGELCHGWGHWLNGKLTAETPWRRLARETAAEATPAAPSRSATAAAIARAAAAVVEDGGVSALTHRAVAARAGVTLGVVSYNFRTSSDLAEAAFETIYLGITEVVRESVHPAPARDEIIASWRDFPSQPRGIFAIEELTLAVARDPALIAFGPQLRYLRGRTSGLQLAARLGAMGDQLSPLDTAIYSSLISGQRRALIGRSVAEIDASLDEIERLIRELHAPS
ncbi:TetR family transcriptional regulator [Novosphingobium sp. PhB165]|uniref:TetR/AcrR family transcriptional regulator n=1 Tax=Novosphingobium sp. PhB165 TaxID=2485105 RepID=UPI0010E7C567|nr:TetR/AcrR family transcriptional regulator [Novosphingobium sp. PhB165]TCM18026.1 TetR family transcriptional regulator [Novosphingobium sp. PhB165]